MLAFALVIATSPIAGAWARTPAQPTASPQSSAAASTVPLPPIDVAAGIDESAAVTHADDAGIDALAPGEFVWTQTDATGPLVVVVSLPTQRLHVYRGGTRIAVSTISSGKPGHDTPTGVFPILQKREHHRSNLYDDAPMPFMQRLTWDGIALHAGALPGRPASHGCIRLPRAFARRLFEATERGTLVVVADTLSHDADVVYPGDRAPVDAISGLPLSRYDALAVDPTPLREANTTATAYE